MNAFVKDVHEYKREYDIIKFANYDLAFYLSKRENIPFETALKFVLDSIRPNGGVFALKNPEVRYLERNKYGDREVKVTNLLDYIYNLTEKELIIAPNLTCYIPPKIRKSILAEYIQVNMKLRKADKKMMFTCRMRGEKEAAAYFKTLQETRKIKNNSVSGMHASPSTPWFNKSSHSTLTSTCRCATSYANSANEKFLGGLRHYADPNTVISHINVAAQHSNLDAIRRCHEKFGIVYPTADQCMEVVRHSTQYYWTNDYYEREIYEFLKALEPVERAAFAYTGDFYHLDKFNSKFIEMFLLEMAEMKTGVHSNPKDRINSLDDNYTAIASLLCAPLIKGVQLGDAEEQRPEAYNAVALTSDNMEKVVEKYIDFFHAFLRQEYLPLAVAAFPTSFRLSVPTSDTDSTIFTTQYWCDKYGGVPFSHEHMSIQYVMTFLIAGMTEHTLKMYSANIGVDPSQLGQLEMKNEYIFPTYVLTSIAKHYFAYISAGEGNVYNDLVLETKGVQLRSSNAPPEINAAAKDLMRHIMDLVMSGKDVYMKDVLLPALRTELEVKRDILRGGRRFFNSTRINDYESYTQGKKAPAYQSYEFWNDVFADKYGEAPEPPYRALKINVDLPNKTKVAEWLAGVTDPNIRAKLTKWVADNSKSNVGLFRLPVSIVVDKGIPEELLPIIDLRGIIIEVMKPFYYVLEAVGLFMVDKKVTRLLSDSYTVEMLESLETATA